MSAPLAITHPKEKYTCKWFLFLRFVLCFDGIISETDAVQNPSFFALPNEPVFFWTPVLFYCIMKKKGDFLW